jgi:DNA-binding NtrC family response regulator
MNRSDRLIAVIDDDVSVREGVAGLLRAAGHRVQTFASAREYLARRPTEPPLCLVLDVQLPGMTGLDLQRELAKMHESLPIIFLTGRGDIPMSVQAMKAGAIDFFTKPVDAQRLLECIEAVVRRSGKLQRADGAAGGVEGVIGQSDAVTAVLRQAATVAPTDATVLILGETGTGKELIARSIHRMSPRAARPMLAVNCSAIPQSLISSELFGHEKGAFTGALERRIGRFEQAAGGTLFLDEVGDLPAETQIALLRVLQEREFERVGGAKPIHADVRIVAATNRDLEAAIADGTFRRDLYYRLNVFPIEVPPLRQRPGDTRLLVEHFVDHYARQTGKTICSISKQTMELLEAYPWPGNIRELQNVIERAVILCDSDTLSIDEPWLQTSRVGGTRAPLREFAPISEVLPLDPTPTLEETQRSAILRALEATGGTVGGPYGAAALLGIKRTSLQTRMQKLGIESLRRAVPRRTLSARPPASFPDIER